MPASIDPQIGAIREDGSAHGIMDVNVKSGQMVSVPFREGHFSVSGAAWAIDPIGGGQNDDGSCSYIQFATATTVPAPTPQFIRFLFYGTQLGIRFDPTFTSGGGGIYDFCTIIDRVAYRINKARYYDDTLAAWNIGGNGAHTVIVARDLPDGPHYAEINITPQAGVNGQIIWGFSADAKYYRQYQGRGHIGLKSALTTSFANINLAAAQQNRGLGLKCVVYANVDTVARIVTVQDNGTTIWTSTIQPNMSDVFDPRTILGSSSNNLKHKVDAITTTAVQATVIGGN